MRVESEKVNVFTRKKDAETTFLEIQEVFFVYGTYVKYIWIE